MLPLLNAIQQHPKTNIKLFNDERQLAFWAKAFAKTTRHPVVLLVTSGTAIANLLPGVMESYHDQTPLIIITCDRPWELQNARANQTVNQVNIYREFSKLNLNLPALTEDFSASALLANLDQLVATTNSLPAGPVHLNLAFRKPYTEDVFDFNQISVEQQDVLTTWASRKKPFRTLIRYQPVPDLGSLDLLTNDLTLSKKTLIIAGPQDPANAEVLNQLARKIKAPILADIDSNLRGRSQSLSLYNLYLNNLAPNFNPDLILYFGDRIVSENLRKFISKQDCPKYLFTESHCRQDAIENEMINFDYHFFVSLTDYTKALEYKLFVKESSDYLNYWQQKEAEQSANCRLLLTKNYQEASAIYLAIKSIPNNSLVYHSSSLVFRELEYFAEFDNQNITICSNRGCVGIDGVLSSALGARDATQQNTYLFIGDQALNHDITALALLPRDKFHIFLINNSGGAVFNLLNDSSVNSLLINPQKFDYPKIAESFNLDFLRVQSLNELEARMLMINMNSSSTFTEIITDGLEASEFFRRC
jgi:2-succinyl-5-enolpyruvyl-6-hydroxy-3-cyclohexene-1-carboxylate synthase